jgi:hypothetical protein
MPSLGDFGVPKPPPESMTFGWFGMDVRVADDFGETTFIEWMDTYGDVENGTGAALVALMSLLRGLVHADDFDGFWRLSREHHQGAADFSALVWGVVGAIAGRPTERSGQSSPGPQPNEEESKVTFLRRVSAGRPDIEAGLMEAALARGPLVGT